MAPHRTMYLPRYMGHVPPEVHGSRGTWVGQNTAEPEARLNYPQIRVEFRQKTAILAEFDFDTSLMIVRRGFCALGTPYRFREFGWVWLDLAPAYPIQPYVPRDCHPQAD